MKTLKYITFLSGLIAFTATIAFVIYFLNIMGG